MAKNDTTIGSKVETLKHRVVSLEHQFENRIKTHPIQSTAIAFGSGIVAGMVTTFMLRKAK